MTRYLPGTFLTRNYKALFFVLLSFGSPAVHAASTELNIITDIAPIHSLVSMVATDNTEVGLLIQPAQSPHAFSLKPSQRRALDKAQLVILLSDAFTPSLHRYLRNADNDRSVLILSQSHGTAHTHKNEGNVSLHEEIPDTKHVTTKSTPLASQIEADHQPSYDLENDLHTWLDPENAIEWLDKIAEALIHIDPEHSEQYELNAASAKQQLSTMHIELKRALEPVRAESYIVYHDAYNHFAKSYVLQRPIAIALSDARSPGAAKLRTIQAHAATARCAFSEVLHDESIVDMVTQHLPIKRAILDPTGTNQALGKSLYPKLIRVMAQRFIDCLSD